MKVIALIPARGGSKGIPRKNLKKVGTFSLLARRIVEAKKSLCDEIHVSTEDDEIGAEVLKFGAHILRRPEELAQDDTSTDSVLLHAIESLSLNDEDILVLLQATSPFLGFKRINECIDALKKNTSANSAITLRIGHPFVWAEKTDFFEPHGHAREKRPRRQDLGIEGWETGGCYAIRVSALRTQGVRYPSPTLGVSVNHLEALDIDTLDDLDLAESIMSALEMFEQEVEGSHG